MSEPGAAATNNSLRFDGHLHHLFSRPKPPSNRLIPRVTIDTSGVGHPSLNCVTAQRRKLERKIPMSIPVTVFNPTQSELMIIVNGGDLIEIPGTGPGQNWQPHQPDPNAFLQQRRPSPKRIRYVGPESRSDRLGTRTVRSAPTHCHPEPKHRLAAALYFLLAVRRDCLAVAKRRCADRLEHDYRSASRKQRPPG